jgi:REP element-mobilizing transposase RayT
VRKYEYGTADIRRRRLPHWDVEGGLYFVTFRLMDSVPFELLTRLRHNREIALDRARRLEPDRRDTAIETAERDYRRSVERTIDRGQGACHLLDSEIAHVIDGAIRFFDSERYRLLAWTLMPNHVHVAYESFAGWTLDRVLHSWKSYTGSECNRLLGRSGAFWEDEYFDRLLRDSRELEAVVRYIAENPAKAGLSDWNWTSMIPGRIGELL